MLLIAKRIDVDLNTLTLAKVRCASTVRHLMRDQRSLTALDIALKFANGEATRTELDDAATAAAAAYYSTPSYAYTDVSAAATAAYAAEVDNNAAVVAVYAAATSAAAYNDDARNQNRKSTANICREVLTDAVFKKLDL